MDMKNIYTGVVLVVVLALALLALQYKGGLEPVAEGETAVYSNPEIGLTFTYRTGPEGYVLTETSPSSPDLSNALRTIILTPATDANLPEPEAGESAPVMTIIVYPNPDMTPSEWVYELDGAGNPQDIKDVVVGGAKAVSYKMDGLYASESIVVTYGVNAYVFSGEYIDAESQLKKDFAPLVESVRFIEIVDNAAGAPVSGKLDINAVCDGALAYMSFPSGKEADAFLVECKAGNRPEVIEKYKQDNGLDGATI